MAIGTYGWDGVDCATAEPHWNPTSEVHGVMNGTPSHAGDLDNFFFLPDDQTQIYLQASKPTLYGPDSIEGKTILLYSGTTILGPDFPKADICYFDMPIACCTITKPFDFAKRPD